MSAPSDGARADARKRLAADAFGRSTEPCCDHSLQWHHEKRGCGYHGFAADRCPCLLPFDEALAGVIADAKAEALREFALNPCDRNAVFGLTETAQHFGRTYSKLARERASRIEQESGR